MSLHPQRNDKKTLLWLQSGGCGGCTLSLLCAETPDLYRALEFSGIELLWHPSLSLETGTEVDTLFAQIRAGEVPLDILCLEGSVMMGPNGTGRFHMAAGGEQPMKDVIAEFAHLAQNVVAIGSCAAFGGMTAAGHNEVEACGLSFDGDEPGGLLGPSFRARSGRPVINIAGCPIHPGWVIETLALLAAGTYTEEDADPLGRPRLYTDQLVHHGCPRNEYYEFKASAEQFSDLGCMMEHLGCKGTQANADCNIRPWNGSGSCLKGGYSCINCTAPGFENPNHSFVVTPKIAGIPIGLPTDMPKAWFVALASLSKAATPKRLRENAVSPRIRVSPALNKLPHQVPPGQGDKE
jgi:ferredoxin hydrogenase small subunit